MKILLVLSFFLLPLFTVLGVTPVEAQSGMTADACELKYISTPPMDIDGYNLCMEYVAIDTAVEACDKERTIAERQECLDAIKPASDGYDGTSASSSSSTSTSSSQAEDQENPYTVSYQQYDEGDNPIYIRLNQVINFLSVGLGIVITGSLIFAGIQWAAARDDPQASSRAIKRIVNTAIALLLYVFGYALLNWLVPGGVLG